MVSREDVVWAYRLLLCREPDEAYLADHQRANADRASLRDAFTASHEFTEYLAHKGYGQVRLVRCADKFERPFYVNDQFLPCLEDLVVGRYQPEASAMLRKALRPAEHFIDVGASTGWFSLLASERVRDAGRVFAFEPHGATFEALKRTVVLRKKDHIISCVRMALGDRNSFAHLAPPPVPDGRGARLAEWRTVERAPLCSLDSLQFSGPVALIKINTNGSERAVVAGARNTIETHRPRLLIPARVATDVLAMVKEIGYSQRPSEGAHDDDDLVMLEPDNARSYAGLSWVDSLLGRITERGIIRRCKPLLVRCRRSSKAPPPSCASFVKGEMIRRTKLGRRVMIRRDLSDSCIFRRPAGTSLTRVLNAALEPRTSFGGFDRCMFGRFSSFDEFAEQLRTLTFLSPKELPSAHGFVTAHMSYSTLSQAYPSGQFLTVLREPMTRLLSHWLYWRSHTDEHLLPWGLEWSNRVKIS